MKHVRFEPWKGENYLTSGFNGKKVLVIGESFYCSEEEAVPTLTKKVITDYLVTIGAARINPAPIVSGIYFERRLTGALGDGDEIPCGHQRVFLFHLVRLLLGDYAYHLILYLPDRGTRERW